MKELEPRDVDRLRFGLRLYRQHIAKVAEEAKGAPGANDWAKEERVGVEGLDEALQEPLNQLVTPPAKKTTPAPEAVR